LRSLDARSSWTSVAVGFIIAGAVLRLLTYFSQGSLYVDDASLSLNIASRSFAGLVKPLDYEQVASIPFLWGEKFATLVGGTNEYALRAIPLLAGIAVLALLWRIGRRLLGEDGAALATCLGAFSILLTSYAGAVKQYSMDALVTLMLVWLVLDVLRASANSAAWWRLAAGGAGALWISQPAVFILAGAALALPASSAVQAAPAWQRRYAFTIIAWAGAFAVIYVLVYRAGETDTYLQQFWEPTFLRPGTPDFLQRARGAWRAMLEAPVVWPGGAARLPPLVLNGLTGAAFLAGILLIFRAHGPALVLLLAGPYVAVLGAGMLGKYPLTDRLLLFAAPLLFFTYASALRGATRLFPQRMRGAALAAVFVLLTVWRYPSAVEQALHPPRRRETKALVRAIALRAPDAPVYLLTPGIECVCSVWVFYTTDWNAPDTARLRWFGNSREGTSLAGRRHELIGAAARLEYRPGGKWWPAEPDGAWVARESERIRSVANPVAWVLATERYPETAITHLLQGMRQRGGRLVFAGRVPGASLWEVEFSHNGVRSPT
jgi:hypothetical protein